MNCPSCGHENPGVPPSAASARHPWRLRSSARTASGQIQARDSATAARLRLTAPATPERDSRAVGLDFSRGMLRVAQRVAPGVPLAQADLNRELPLLRGVFDAFFCALVSEHLASLRTLFTEAFAVLRRGGRLLFSAFHPELAAAGIEANSEVGGTEYRLGAERHTVGDYLNYIYDAGFRESHWEQYCGDSKLLEEVPGADKYLGRPLLLIIEASRPIDERSFRGTERECSAPKRLQRPGSRPCSHRGRPTWEISTKGDGP